VRINTFLQSWQTYLNSKNQLPELKMLMDTAKKYNVRIEGIAFSRKILLKMPMWYHKEAHAEIRSMNSTTASACLRLKHGLQTVGDAVKLISTIQSADHQPNSLCECVDCNKIREMYECDHPHGCARQATKLLDTLPPKWDPRSELPEDYQEAPGVKALFDNRVTTRGSLADIFRIFTDDKLPTTNQLPNLRPINRTGIVNFTIGGASENRGNEDAKAGAALYFGIGHHANRSAKLPRYLERSKTAGEILAVKVAAETID
ncbi:hypothetical protein BT96DRAFT_755928, partial [Gymnopus androsaceus JB14]